MPEIRQSRYAPRELSDEAIAWIVRLHSGEVGNAERSAFAEWRQQSDAHEQAAREAEALWDDASQLHRDPRNGFIHPGRRPSGPSRRAVLGGLGGLACAGMGAWAVSRQMSPAGEHATGIAETRTIEFIDGSRATLNAMTALDVAFTADRRQITLIKGQAYFEVRSDAARPFIVQAGNLDVRALGTAFDVNVSLPGQNIAVAVTEHAVQVGAFRTDAAHRPPLVISEGERAVMARDGTLKTRESQSADITQAWRSGLYIAEGRRLDEVLSALSAYHPGWIIARDDALKALRVNAVLDLRSPSASLDALADGLPIRVLHASRYLTIISNS